MGYLIQNIKYSFRYLVVDNLIDEIINDDGFLIGGSVQFFDLQSVFKYLGENQEM